MGEERGYSAAPILMTFYSFSRRVFELFAMFGGLGGPSDGPNTKKNFTP